MPYISGQQLGLTNYKVIISGWGLAGHYERNRTRFDGETCRQGMICTNNRVSPYVHDRTARATDRRPSSRCHPHCVLVRLCQWCFSTQLEYCRFLIVSDVQRSIQSKNGRGSRCLPQVTLARKPATQMSPSWGERIVSSKTSNASRLCGGAAVAESASASTAKTEVKRMDAKAKKKGYVLRRSKNFVGV